MLRIVQGERPEAFDRRHLALGKGDRIDVVAIQLVALAHRLLFRFLGSVVVHVRLGGARLDLFDDAANSIGLLSDLKRHGSPGALVTLPALNDMIVSQAF
jgi:hypothetical protein